METALLALSLIGVAVFSASGALASDEENFDLVGALFLSIATGLGGGTIVDVIIGHQPVRWIEEPISLWIAASAGLAAFLATRVTKLPHALLLWADAAGIAVFTAAGMARVTHMGFDPLICVFLTALGASGGGILRDVLANRTPIVFSPETELYVTAVFSGALAYLLIHAITPMPEAPLIAALVVTAAVRAAGIVFKLKLGTMRRG